MSSANPGWLNLWRAGLTAGVSAILWLDTQFVTNAKFELYAASHKDWSIEAIKRLESEIGDLKENSKRIESKVDVLLHEHKQAAIYKQMLEEIYE